MESIQFWSVLRGKSRISHEKRGGDANPAGERCLFSENFYENERIGFCWGGYVGEGERRRGEGRGKGRNTSLDPPMVFIQGYIIITCNYCGRSRRYCHYICTPAPTDPNSFVFIDISSRPPNGLVPPPQQEILDRHLNYIITWSIRRHSRGVCSIGSCTSLILD